MYYDHSKQGGRIVDSAVVRRRYTDNLSVNSSLLSAAQKPMHLLVSILSAISGTLTLLVEVSDDGFVTGSKAWLTGDGCEWVPAFLVSLVFPALSRTWRGTASVYDGKPQAG